MINNSIIPFPVNKVDIKKEIENLSNWIDADIKYQIWSLNAPCVLNMDIHNMDIHNEPSVKKDSDIFLLDVKAPA